METLMMMVNEATWRTMRGLAFGVAAGVVCWAGVALLLGLSHLYGMRQARDCLTYGAVIGCIAGPIIAARRLDVRRAAMLIAVPVLLLFLAIRVGLCLLHGLSSPTLGLELLFTVRGAFWVALCSVAHGISTAWLCRRFND